MGYEASYKVGDKFIIEIESVKTLGAAHSYVIKNGWYVKLGEEVLDELEKYEKSEGYQEGLNAAWEAARKMFDMDRYKFNAVFGEDWNMEAFQTMFDTFTPQEAISKIKAYEERKKMETIKENEVHLCAICKGQKKAEEEIKVGDEVEDNKVKEKGVVIAISPEEDDDTGEQIYVLFAKSNYPIDCTRDDISKTGRHFDIEGILKAMREE